MQRKDNILNKCGARRPFSVPDGYFDNLTENIMAALPDTSNNEVRVVVTLWMRIRPYLYAAAAFTGIFFLISLAVGISSSKEEPQMAQETTIYSDEYIDSFLETAMIDDYTLYYTLVESAN